MPNTHVFTGLDGAISVAVESGRRGRRRQGGQRHLPADPDRAGHRRDDPGRAPTCGRSTRWASATRPSCAPGNINVKGTIGRAHVNGALLKLMLGDGAARAPGRRARSSARRSTSRCRWRTRHSPATASTVTVHSVKLDELVALDARGRLRAWSRSASRRCGSASRTPRPHDRRSPTSAAQRSPRTSCCSAGARRIASTVPGRRARPGRRRTRRARSCCGRSCWPTCSGSKRPRARTRC